MKRHYTRRPLADRFWERVRKQDGGCWLWTGTFGSAGYGMITECGQHWKAHRLAWHLVRGAIPDGLWVLHRCDNRACVNPGHLFLGNNDDNVADREAKGRNANKQKTHCPRGHVYDEQNTMLLPRADRSPGRACRTCYEQYQREYRAQRQRTS